jgi:phage shock protein PspC (stress-responsive transcriptional regulator)
MLGGVCSGIAARTGWDLGLVRGVVAVLAIFLGPVWIAYGVAWALLPEQRDGRIHLETLALGHFDIAQLGAAIMILLGFGNIFPWVTGGGPAYMVIGLVVLGLAAAIVAVAGSRTGQNRPGRQTPPVFPTAPEPDGPASPHAAAPEAPFPAFPADAGPSSAADAAPGQDSPSLRTGPEGDALPPPSSPSAADWRTQGGPVPGASSFTGAAAGYDQPPASGVWSRIPAPSPAETPLMVPIPPRRRPVSSRVNLVVTGLVVLVVAAVLYLYRVERDTDPGSFSEVPLLVGGALCLILVGGALAIAAIRDRGAGWLVALSVVGALIGAPLAAGYSANRAHVDWEEDAGSASVGQDVLGNSVQEAAFDWTADTISDTDSITLDLTGAPVDADKTITVTGPFQDLDVMVAQGQSVTFQINGSLQNITPNYYTGPGRVGDWIPWVPEVSQVVDSLGFRTPWWNSDHAITVVLDSGSGWMTIDEVAPPDPSASPSTSEEGAQSGAQSVGDGAGRETPQPSPTGSTAADQTDNS